MNSSPSFRQLLATGLGAVARDQAAIVELPETFKRTAQRAADPPSQKLSLSGAQLIFLLKPTEALEHVETQKRVLKCKPIGLCD